MNNANIPKISPILILSRTRLTIQYPIMRSLMSQSSWAYQITQAPFILYRPDQPHLNRPISKENPKIDTQDRDHIFSQGQFLDFFPILNLGSEVSTLSTTKQKYFFVPHKLMNTIKRLCYDGY